jgi:hypothetical protein
LEALVVAAMGYPPYTWVETESFSRKVDALKVDAYSSSCGLLIEQCGDESMQKRRNKKFLLPGDSTTENPPSFRERHEVRCYRIFAWQWASRAGDR